MQPVQPMQPAQAQTNTKAEPVKDLASKISPSYFFIGSSYAPSPKSSNGKQGLSLDGCRNT